MDSLLCMGLLAVASKCEVQENQRHRSIRQIKDKIKRPFDYLLHSSYLFIIFCNRIFFFFETEKCVLPSDMFWH